MKERHIKYIFNSLIVLSAGLAFIGFKIYYAKEAPSTNIIDVIYSVIRLFILENDFEYSNENIYIGISRFLAPISLATAVIINVLSAFTDTIQKLRVNLFTKNHIIFCGDNKNLLPLIKEQGKNNKTCVTLSPNLEYDDFDIVHYNESISPSKLNKIGFYRCKYLIISFDQDVKAIEFASKVVKAVNTKKLTKKINIKLVINQPDWADLTCDLALLDNLNNHIDFDDNLNIGYINYLDKGIRKVLMDNPPDSSKPVRTPQSPSPEILVTGYNNLAKRMLIGLALSCHYINTQKTRVFWHVKKITDIQAFIARYQLDKILNIVLIDQIGEKELFTKIDATYFCDELAVELYKSIASVCSLNNTYKSQKVVCAKEYSLNIGMTEEQKLKNKYLEYYQEREKVIAAFEANEESLTFDTLFDEKHDKLAKTLHQYYCDKYPGAMLEWDKLYDASKDSSRYAADHIYTVIRSLNREDVLDNKNSTKEGFSKDYLQNHDYFERLSEAEHNRWAAFTYIRGYQLAGERNDALKKHPDLIPYDKLSEDDKDKDRNNILLIPELLEKLKENSAQ